ncbi:MAG: carbon monoxide dehydrogenase, partial [Desulfobacterales bacterium]|nr:carbon monoxide dehydrogenase [Desulfobacterales bacterium]
MAEEEKKEVEKKEVEKKKKKAAPKSIDPATLKMIARAEELEIETIFDRAEKMKPCPIGSGGTCCKNCSMGPCRLPLPKAGIEGEDERKGLCGATANTIAARNFIRMIAGGAAAHSDHGRGVAETFLAVAKKETEDYVIKDTKKLLEIAPDFGVALTEGKGEKEKPRKIDDIALEVAEKALAQWGQQEGEVLTARRAPEKRVELWREQGVFPRGIDREIVEIMHRTHMGVDQDYKNLMFQGTRAAIADGWGGSMIATDLQDILFGTPYPLKSQANLGVLKEDMVNLIIHGHEPLLSEMIVVASELPEMQELA